MRSAPALLVLCLAVGCARSSPPSEDVAADTAGASLSASEVDAAVVARDSADTTAATQVATVPRSAVFPHAPHRDVTCRTCHGAIRGHATHTSVDCKECHAAPVSGAARTMTRAECLSCHHGPRQSVGCATCHAPVEPRPVTRTLELSVWTAPRAVTLPFDHARHQAPGCAACHQTPPFLPPDRACGTCHDRHHRPDAACVSCHAAPPPGVHDVRVHGNGSCSGSGCHAATAVAELPRSREACSVCHRDRAQHYPERDCAPCHRLRAAPEEDR